MQDSFSRAAYHIGKGLQIRPHHRLMTAVCRMKVQDIRKGLQPAVAGKFEVESSVNAPWKQFV